MVAGVRFQQPATSSPQVRTLEGAVTPAGTPWSLAPKCSDCAILHPHTALRTHLTTVKCTAQPPVESYQTLPALLARSSFASFFSYVYLIYWLFIKIPINNKLEVKLFYRQYKISTDGMLKFTFKIFRIICIYLIWKVFSFEIQKENTELRFLSSEDKIDLTETSVTFNLFSKTEIVGKCVFSGRLLTNMIWKLS